MDKSRGSPLCTKMEEVIGSAPHGLASRGPGAEEEEEEAEKGAPRKYGSWCAWRGSGLHPQPQNGAGNADKEPQEQKRSHRSSSESHSNPNHFTSQDLPHSFKQVPHVPDNEVTYTSTVSGIYLSKESHDSAASDTVPASTPSDADDELPPPPWSKGTTPKAEESEVDCSSVIAHFTHDGANQTAGNNKQNKGACSIPETYSSWSYLNYKSQRQVPITPSPSSKVCKNDNSLFTQQQVLTTQTQNSSSESICSPELTNNDDPRQSCSHCCLGSGASQLYPRILRIVWAHLDNSPPPHPDTSSGVRSQGAYPPTEDSSILDQELATLQLINVQLRIYLDTVIKARSQLV